MSELVEDGNLVCAHHVGCDFATHTLAVLVNRVDDDTPSGLAHLVRDVNADDWIVHCLAFLV